MRTKFILSLLFSLILLVSCKNEKPIDSLDVVSPEKIADNTFKVTLNVIVKGDDTFSLYYTEDGSIDFKGEPLWLAVKGNESAQDVAFSLPKDVYPTQLRLDFGMNTKQEDIFLKAVTFEYKGNKKQIVGADLINYFIADQSKCSFDSTTGLIKAIVKDGVRQYPSLYPQNVNLKPLLENFGKQ